MRRLLDSVVPGQRLKLQQPEGIDWHSGARRKGIAVEEFILDGGGFVSQAGCVSWCHGRVFEVRPYVELTTWAAFELNFVKSYYPDTSGCA